MLKKITPVIILLCLILNINVTAENITPSDKTTPETPRTEFTPPEGEFTPPEGEFTPPEGEFTPPEGGFAPPEGGFMPGNMGGFPGNMQNTTQETTQETGFAGFVKTYSTPLTSVILLGLAFIFVIFYKRKNY